MTIQIKKCRSCNEIKPLTDFNKNSQYKSGIHNHCRLCVRSKGSEAAFKWRSKQKDFLDKESCCACGFNHPSAKEVHHLSSTYKRFGRSQSMFHNIQDIQAGKAVVLCPTCHVLFHGAHGGKNQSFPLYTKEETIMQIKEMRVAS